MLGEKAHHLDRGVRSLWIGIGTAGAPSRPGMTRLMNHPLLQNGLPPGVAVDTAGVGMSTCSLSRLNRHISRKPVHGNRPIVGHLKPLLDHVISVDRGDS